QNPLPKLPPELRHWQRFTDRALAKSPTRRFQDARQMQAALDAIARDSGTHASRLGAAARRAFDTLRKLPRTAWIPVVLVVAAVAGLALRDTGDDGTTVDTSAPTARQAGAPADSPAAGVEGMEGVSGVDDPSAALL